jgi:rubrerythrin
VEALKIAVEIEELDIKDLREGAARSNHAELKAVYGNLEAASVRHLQAFMRNLKARDGEYTPKHLDVKTFNELASGENTCEDDCAPASGNGRGQGRGRGPRGG